MVHVRITDEEEFSDFPSFAVIKDGVEENTIKIVNTDESVELYAGKVLAVINKEKGTFDFFDSEGNTLVAEPPEGGTFFQGDMVGCEKKSPQNEHYYGFGEKTGPLDKRGESMVMWNRDMPYNYKSDPMYQSHPFFIGLRAGRAYGIFFDNSRKTFFDMASSVKDRYRFYAEDGELDYWVIAGPHPGDVLDRFADLVGKTLLPPLWGLGYHQCRWSYKNEEKVREIKNGFEQHQIPLDALYLDIHYMDGYRVFTFDNDRFPDPPGLVDELMADGVRTVVIVDPGVKIDRGYRIYDEMMENKYYVYDKDGGPFTASVWPGPVHFPDYYREEVRDWWGDLHKFYTDIGIAGVWNDMNEPAGSGRNIRFLDMQIPLAPAKWLDMRHGTPPDFVHHDRVHNVYALLEAESTYEGITKFRPDERPFIISRAGYPGIQRYTLIWTGDNYSTWRSMQVGSPMSLNMSMSGLPFTGADIGGFVGSPSKELYARWIEFGTFTPFCRTHTSANTPDQEPWSFGDEVTDIARKHIKLRYRLLPYTYTVFEHTSRTNWPVMRPMIFEFPEDERFADEHGQYMWGEWLLVAPVLKKGRRTKTVKLPEGIWYDFYTGERYEGPTEMVVEAPLAKLPLFAKGGAIIPMAPEMMHTGEKPWSPLTVKIFPADDKSSFTLYEDDGISVANQKGEWSRTKFSVSPTEQGMTVKVEPKSGKFDPGRKSVEFEIYGTSREADVKCGTITGKPVKGTGAVCESTTGLWMIKSPWKDEGLKIEIREKK